MYRYAALSWNSKDPTTTSAAQRLARLLLSSAADWKSALDAPGLRVFHAPQPDGARHAYVLKRGAGVVLGKLFGDALHENQNPSDPNFDDKESNLIVKSRGRRLVERYWGHYVAFLREPHGHRCLVLRDPTGGLPCFMMKAGEIDVILSDVEDCVRLNLGPFSPDWDHLTAFFQYSTELITRTTGLKEVSQLYAGEIAAITDNGDVNRAFYWNPVDVAEADTIEDPDKARAALGSVIRQCVNAWGSSYDNIVLELSGGLDSSIVAACLGHGSAHTNVIGFNFVIEGTDGDERAYARAAADGAGCELIEASCRVSETTLERQLDPARVVSPGVLGFIPESELLKQRLVRERRAGAVFTGQGGDHLFQSERTKLIAAEYAHRHGLRPQLFSVVADTSRLTKQSFWAVFGAAIRYGLFRRSFDPYAVFFDKPPPSILSDNAVASLDSKYCVHPWVEDACRLPANKVQQVFAVVDCQAFYVRPYRYAELIHPLISQPIIEHCLQIPSYVLAHRGKSRGLVREAFATDVPSKIIHRYSKGGSTTYFNRMMFGNLQYLHELLLDGILVREGLLNRNALEKELSEQQFVRGIELLPIVNAVRAEKWLRNWADVEQRSAA